MSTPAAVVLIIIGIVIVLFVGFMIIANSITSKHDKLLRLLAHVWDPYSLSLMSWLIE